MHLNQPKESVFPSRIGIEYCFLRLNTKLSSWFAHLNTRSSSAQRDAHSMKDTWEMTLNDRIAESHLPSIDAHYRTYV